MLKQLGLAVLAAGMVPPSLAADGWDGYRNDRYGYEAAVPPGFVGGGEPDARDGQVFRNKSRQQVLTVWGGYLVDTSFAEDMASRIADLKGKGWNITYQATTPTWASYSGTRGQRVIYVRVISGCEHEQYATFELQYRSIDINITRPIVDRLVNGLKQATCAQ